MNQVQFLNALRRARVVNALDGGEFSPSATGATLADFTEWVALASASTLDIDPGRNFAEGYPVARRFRITGTTTITEMVAAQAPKFPSVWLLFDGACTLQHSDDFQIIGGTNYTTSAGDLLIFTVNGAADKWRHQITIPQRDFAELFRASNPAELAATDALLLTGFPGVTRFTITGTTPIESIANNHKVGYGAWLMFEDGGILVHSEDLVMPNGEDYEVAPETLVYIGPSTITRDKWHFSFAISPASGVVDDRGYTTGASLLFDVPGGAATPTTSPVFAPYVAPSWATQEEAEAGVETDKLMSPARVAEAIAALAGEGGGSGGGIYTVATLPSASDRAGQSLLVSDGNNGLPCSAISDGTNWLRQYLIGPAVATAASLVDRIADIANVSGSITDASDAHDGNTSTYATLDVNVTWLIFEVTDPYIIKRARIWMPSGYRAGAITVHGTFDSSGSGTVTPLAIRTSLTDSDYPGNILTLEFPHNTVRFPYIWILWGDAPSFPMRVNEVQLHEV